MNRRAYFDYIEDKLSHLATRIENRGKLNLLELHNHSEDFYLNFLNQLYGWNLQNLNATQQNVEAIDLVDTAMKIILQVSATCTKEKIESALNKSILSSYTGYSFKYVSISKDASKLKTHTYKNPYNLIFAPADDIYDIPGILQFIKPQKVEDQQRHYDFIKKELGTENIAKLDSNLAAVINVLAKENLFESQKINTKTVFEIERKIQHNSLVSAATLISDYSIYQGRVDRIYKAFDLQGANKSLSVLQLIRKSFLSLKVTMNAGENDKIFFKLFEDLKQSLLNSANLNAIPIDELELCIGVLLTDAFIRCKIFENPQQYNYVVA
jgi:hypothetical protein